jgi:hypothetical protein
VSDAFEDLGHEVWSCDLEPNDHPRHIQGDVLTILDRGWDFAIFHPPCTYLSNSSSKHLYLDGKKENGPDPERWRQLREGAAFFKKLWECDIPHACENPIMLGYAKQLIGCGKQTQTVQPYHFGDPYQKATCLWLHDLPPLERLYRNWDECREALGLPADALPKQEVHLAAPGPDRWKLRSTTYPGIARAMAQQWSKALT